MVVGEGSNAIKGNDGAKVEKAKTVPFPCRDCAVFKANEQQNLAGVDFTEDGLDRTIHMHLRVESRHSLG